MLLTLNTNKTINKNEFKTRRIETISNMNDVVGYSIDEWDFNSSGWIIIECGSRGEMEGVEYLKQGTDDVEVDLDELLDGSLISENPDTNTYAGQDGWALDEFVGVDISDDNICVQRSEESGYIICHITIGGN